MAFKHGSNAEVWLDGIDLSEFLTQFDLSVDVETADTTVFKSSWKRAIPGTPSATTAAAGLFDPTMTNVTGILQDDASVLTYFPAGGSAVGDPGRLISVESTAYAESAPVGGVVAFNWGVLADEAVGFGQCLVPLNTFADDTNGTSLDGGASTTTGAIAHLHVVEVSASDSVVVTIEDSANDADWSTIGTFAAKSAAGAERLVIAGTIRRYVRAVINVTGTDVAISLGVAIART